MWVGGECPTNLHPTHQSTNQLTNHHTNKQDNTTTQSTNHQPANHPTNQPPPPHRPKTRETSRLASRLLDTLKRLNPLESAVADARFLQPLGPDQRGVHDLLRQRIQAIYQAAGGGGGGRHVRFPGTMPVNLCRKDVAALQQVGGEVDVHIRLYLIASSSIVCLPVGRSVCPVSIHVFFC